MLVKIKSQPKKHQITFWIEDFELVQIDRAIRKVGHRDGLGFLSRAAFFRISAVDKAKSIQSDKKSK